MRRFDPAFDVLSAFQHLQFPVLETPEGSLCESAAISRYIASIGHNNLYPQPLNPSGMLKHAYSPTVRSYTCTA